MSAALILQFVIAALSAAETLTPEIIALINQLKSMQSQNRDPTVLEMAEVNAKMLSALEAARLGPRPAGQ